MTRAHQFTVMVVTLVVLLLAGVPLAIPSFDGATLDATDRFEQHLGAVGNVGFFELSSVAFVEFAEVSSPFSQLPLFEALELLRREFRHTKFVKSASHRP